MKDENFRRGDSHLVSPNGDKTPVTTYSYETAKRLYMVYLKPNGKMRCWLNGSWSVPHSTHHEICKHFNLGVLNEFTTPIVGNPTDKVLRGSPAQPAV